jgi:cell division protein FtsL
MIDFSKFENLSLTTKRYLLNSFLTLAVLLSISMMFFIQLKVDNLQDQAKEVDAQISALEDDIRVLQVEWVYLTRPERLRTLSERYLQNNDHIAANQIKDPEILEKYYIATLRKQENVSMNQ